PGIAVDHEQDQRVAHVAHAVEQDESLAFEAHPSSVTGEARVLKPGFRFLGAQKRVVKLAPQPVRPQLTRSGAPASACLFQGCQKRKVTPTAATTAPGIHRASATTALVEPLDLRSSTSPALKLQAPPGGQSCSSLL